MKFRVLGPLEVDAGSGPIPLGGLKQRALLGHLLARANRVVSNDELINALWADDVPDSPKASIQTYVWNLRRALGDDRIASKAPGYVLVATQEELDSLLFETLVRESRRYSVTDRVQAVATLDTALGLWRGGAYADLQNDPELKAEATRLANLRLTAIEDRIEASLALGRAGDVVGELEALTREHPTRERFWRQLMLALYRSGRQGQALEAYLRARRVIVDELGVEPGPELQRLHMRMLKHDAALEIAGTPLRGYVLVEKIGEGAFGSVHRAVQPEVRRDVAIKVIHSRFAADPDFIRRFEQEAQVVARLEHPHIVPLYDYWRDPGGAYLVMRFMPGGNLAHRLTTGPLDVESAARVVDDVATALAFAHRQNVVHRDVRPPNVLFDDEGNAYLSDFGIAKLLTAATDVDGGSSSSAYYMSPEEIEGGAVSAATDVYSLGLMMFELLAGRHPFAETPPSEIFARHLAGELPAVTRDRPELSPAVDEVIRRASARNASDRFATASEAAAAFREAAHSRAVPATPVEIRNPYKGLRAFHEPDAVDFFGRKALVEKLVARLGESRLLAVVGPSGSGKSSAVRAGLVPALRAGALAGSEHWFVVDMTPGAHPFDELEEALTRVAGERISLERDPSGLLRATDGIESELLIVIDQFEEVFTHVDDDESRVRFLDCIRTAITDVGSRVRIVLTLRADFFDRPLLYRSFGDLLAESTQPVAAMTATDVESAIVGPASNVGIEVETGLIAEIVSDIGDQPALPLLQYALTELLERRVGDTLTLDAFHDLGGLSGAIGRRADAIYARLEDADREATRQLFLRLITPGEEGAPETRRRVLLSELDDPSMERVIDLFGAHRLLSFDRDAATRSPTVEVAHEALIREWPRLRGWIDSARDDVRAHRRLRTEAQEWERADREESFLLSGVRLDQTEAWRTTASIALTAREREYVSASIARRDRERDRERVRVAHEARTEHRSRTRLRALVAVFAIATVVASTLTALAVNQQAKLARQGRVTFARELAAASLANLSIDPQRSILLALQAVKATKQTDGDVVPEAVDALHRSVVASRVQLMIPNAGTMLSWDHKRDVIAFASALSGTIDERSGKDGKLVASWDTGLSDTTGLVALPDGTVATTGAGGSIDVWDPLTGRLIRALSDGRATVTGLSSSADGRTLAAVWYEGEQAWVDVWNVATRHKILTIRGLKTDLGFNLQPTTWLSPDGSRIAIALLHGQVDVYDVATGHLRQALAAGIEFRIRKVAWRHDGRRLVTVGEEFAQVWDDAGHMIAPLSGHQAPVGAADWSPDDSHIVTASDDGTVRVWLGAVEYGMVPMVLSGHHTTLRDAAFGPTGDRVISVGADRTAIIWNVGVDGDAEWANYAIDPLWYGDVTYSKDGKLLVGTALGGVTKVWDAQSGQELRTLSVAHDGPQTLMTSMGRVAISTDGLLIATGSFDSTVRIWRADTGELLQTLRVHKANIEHLAFNSTGTLLATSAIDQFAYVTEVATGRRLAALQHDRVHVKFAFGAGDRTLITGDGDPGQGNKPSQIRVWDIATGTVLTAIKVEGFLRTLAVNPARTLVAVGYGDGRAEVWSLRTQQLVTTLRGSSSPLFAIGWSADGRRLAIGNDAGDLKIWDPLTGVTTMTLPNAGGPVGQVSFSPDGRRLAVSAADKIRVWALDLDDLVTVANHKLARGLTVDECRQYLHLGSCPAAG